MAAVLLRWLILMCAILITSYMMDGIQVSGFLSAFFAAAILSILNAFLRPILFILTLPLNVLTFGLFTFVLNAFMLFMASGLIPGFHVRGFWTAVFGSILIGAFSWLLNSFIIRQGKIEYIDLRHKGGNRWE